MNGRTALKRREDGQTGEFLNPSANLDVVLDGRRDDAAQNGHSTFDGRAGHGLRFVRLDQHCNNVTNPSSNYLKNIQSVFHTCPQSHLAT